jgi:hypothetical protein
MVRIIISLPNTQTGGTPLVGCPLILVQYIRNYLPHLETVCFNSNLRFAMPW